MNPTTQPLRDRHGRFRSPERQQPHPQQRGPQPKRDSVEDLLGQLRGLLDRAEQLVADAIKQAAPPEPAWRTEPQSPRVRVLVTYAAGGTVYEYLAIRVRGTWYTTGVGTPSMSWRKFTDQFDGARSVVVEPLYTEGDLPTPF